MCSMQTILGGCSCVPSLVLVSGADEYMPEHVDRHRLAQRLSQAMSPNSRGCVLNGGKHNLAGSEDQLISHILEFLEDIT